MEVGYHSPHLKTQHRQGHLIQAHIPPLSNCKATGEEPLPYITANIPITPTQNSYKTQNYTVTALHTVNNTIAKGFNQRASPCLNNHCSTRYEQSFGHNKHTHIYRKLLQTKIPDTSIGNGGGGNRENVLCELYQL